MKNTERDGYNELTSLLPITITRIQVQKNNKDRFSLYHENRFLLGIKSQTLVFCSLKKGTLLTDELLESILNAEQYNKANPPPKDDGKKDDGKKDDGKKDEDPAPSDDKYMNLDAAQPPKAWAEL